jgi:hypothetical protein
MYSIVCPHKLPRSKQKVIKVLEKEKLCLRQEITSNLNKISRKIAKTLYQIFLNISAHSVSLIFLHLLYLLGHERGSSLVAVYKKVYPSNVKRVIVFDFDGTLIGVDSFGMLINNLLRERSILKRFLFSLVGKLYSNGLINNTQFKKISTRILLRNISEDELYKEALDIADYIITQKKVNIEVIEKLVEYCVDDANQVIILSASPIEIIKAIFKVIIKNLYEPEFGRKIYEKILFVGSEFIFDGNKKVLDLGKNIFSIKKREALNNMGIYKIDTFFTDSEKDDKYIIEIAEKTYLVKNGILEELK